MGFPGQQLRLGRRLVAPGTPEPEAREALTLATANLWSVSTGPRDIVRLAPAIEERLEAFAERLERSDIDVVGLQEMWTDKPRQAFVRRLRARFPWCVDVHSELRGSGLVILSRVPIDDADVWFHLFDRRGAPWRLWEADWVGRKGVVGVRLKLGERRVLFANTHTIASYQGHRADPDWCDRNGEIRYAQSQELVRFVDALAGADPAVMVGDFNCIRGSRCHRVLTQHWTEVQEPSAPEDRLDFIWTRAGRDGDWDIVSPPAPDLDAPVRVGGKLGEVPLSDHQPILAKLQLRNL